MTEHTPISVTVKGAAKISGLGERTMWNLIKERKVPSVMIGGRRLVIYDGLQNYIKGHLAKDIDTTLA